jgi:integrase
MDAGSIDIVGSRTIVDKQAVEGSTKTGRSRRVSLGERAVAALREHHTAQLIERDRAGVAWQGPADGYVFVRADGRPIHPDTPSKLMKAFADKAGVPRLRFHDLRHTHATLLLSSGAPDYEVGHRLGHVNPTVTRNIYAHVLPQRADEMGTAFGKLLAGS